MLLMMFKVSEVAVVELGLGTVAERMVGTKLVIFYLIVMGRSLKFML